MGSPWKEWKVRLAMGNFFCRFKQQIGGFGKLHLPQSTFEMFELAPSSNIKECVEKTTPQKYIYS